MMQQQLQLQQIQIQSPQQNQPQYLNQQEQQQQIQNQLIQQQQQSGQLTNASIPQPNISQINIQPKPQMLIGTQSNLATSQAQSMDNRPTIMSMVSISSGNITTTNGTPLIQAHALGIPGLTQQSHVTLQPPQNPLAAMTTLSYNASPTTVNNLNKDDKQKTEQQKINEQLQQTAIQTLVSLSTATTVVSTAPTLTSTTANGDQTNTVSTSSADGGDANDNASLTGKEPTDIFKLESRAARKRPLREVIHVNVSGRLAYTYTIHICLLRPVLTHTHTVVARRIYNNTESE